MNACIINIGDEILIGQIINTNAAWMAEQLNLQGISVEQTIVISDTPEAIVEAVESAKKIAQLILITGGLGPTKDDVTKKTLAEHFGMSLVYHAPSFENIEHLFVQYGIEADDRYRSQAEMPDGATILINKTGTASGMWFDQGEHVIVSMPGVPREVKYLMLEEVIPRVISSFDRPAILHHTLLSTGKGETDLSDLLEDFETKLPSHIKLAYLPNTEKGMVRLRLSAKGDVLEQLQKELEEKVSEIEAALGVYIFGVNEESLEVALGNLLREKQMTITTAESCTGGNIARKITSVAGCSDYFPGSLVAYSNRIKEKQLGVKTETLEQFGAVSEQCVLEMAKGAQQLFETDCAIAVSGIAGPGGGTPTKPVGTIWIAIANREQIYTKKLQLGTNRLQNITRTSNIAMNLMRLSLIDALSDEI